jgi:hypothetical protein
MNPVSSQVKSFAVLMYYINIYKERYGHCRKRNHSLRAVVNIIFPRTFLPTSLFNVSVIMESILLQITAVI